MTYDPHPSFSRYPVRLRPAQNPETSPRATHSAMVAAIVSVCKSTPASHSATPITIHTFLKPRKVSGTSEQQRETGIFDYTKSIQILQIACCNIH
jgi:hypothetical protein